MIHTVMTQDAERNISSEGVVWLTAAGWDRFDWLRHGFSTRRGGVSRVYLPEDEPDGNLTGELNLGFTATDLTENVRENRLRLVRAVTGDGETRLVTVRQVHSNRSEVVSAATFSADGAIPEADGIMTDQPGLLLGIQTADCIPVLVADPVKRAVAGFHAGWRGTVQRIVEAGVAKMAAELGSNPADLVAAIGPGIGRCCYTVGAEVLGQFQSQLSYAEDLFFRSDDGESPVSDSGLHLDLIEANRLQLVCAGLNAGSIAIVGGCTGCQPELFFSHRTSGGHAGRMMAVIGIV